MAGSTDKSEESGGSKCLHCNKIAASYVTCLKCGGEFHSTCMAQANDAKNKTCRHLDGKNLVKEVESQAKVIQKINTKLTAMEETLRKLTDSFEVFQKRAKDQPIVIEEDAMDNLSKSKELIAAVTTELKNHSAIITSKLDEVTNAVKTNNVDLVKMLNGRVVVPSSGTTEASNTFKTATQSQDPKNKSSSSNPLQRSLVNVVKGTNNNASTIAAARDRKWFYVGNLDPESTVELLTQHLQYNSVPVISCEKLKSDEVRASFKISVDPEDQELLLNSDVWPVNVTVKPFLFKHPSTQERGPRGYQRSSQTTFPRRPNQNRRY